MCKTYKWDEWIRFEISKHISAISTYCSLFNDANTDSAKKLAKGCRSYKWSSCRTTLAKCNIISASVKAAA